MIGNKKIIAVCAARIQDEATNNYITALNDVVSRAGYGVIVYNTSTVLNMDNSADTRFYIYSLMDFSIIDVSFHRKLDKMNWWFRPVSRMPKILTFRLLLSADNGMTVSVSDLIRSRDSKLWYVTWWKIIT